MTRERERWERRVFAPDGPAGGADDFELIENLPFKTEEAVGGRAKIGLIVLATDYTIEHEFRRIVTTPGVDFYEARIKNDNQITPETLRAMGARIPDTLSLILPGEPLDVVAYGCTSASMTLGEETVFAKIHEIQPQAKATTPITAAFAAFDAFEAKRIAVLTPYRRDVNAIVRGYIEGRGYTVPVFGSFNEEQDPIAARIDGASLKAAVKTITAGRSVDMVFVSCTSIRLVDAVAEIEAELGVPVTSSNHALAWRCLRLAGVDDKRPELGRLFER